MEAGIVALLTTIGGIALALLKLYTGPNADERKKQREKEEFDKALRDGDLVTLSRLMSEHSDRLQSKGDNSPIRQGDKSLSKP